MFILAINQHAPETGESTGFKRINSRFRKIGLNIFAITESARTAART